MPQSRPFLFRVSESVARRRLLLWPLCIAGLLVIIAFAFVSVNSGKPSGPLSEVELRAGTAKPIEREAARESFEAPDEGKIEDAGTKNRQRVLAEFKQIIGRYYGLLSRLEEVRALIRDRNPLIDAVREYEMQMVNTGTPGLGNPAAHATLATFMENAPEAFQEVVSANDNLYQLCTIAEALQSGDPVGNTTFGAVVGSLYSDPEMMERIRHRVIEAENRYFGLVDADGLSNALQTTEQIIAFLKQRVPVYINRYRDVLTDKIPDENLRNWLPVQYRWGVFNQLAKEYEKKVMTAAAPLEEEANQLLRKAVQLKASMPYDSEENIEMARILSDPSPL